MNIKSIIGGVSPLKARKSAGKAGKVGKKATATRAQDKSGFSRSDTIDTGKGYKSNLESLTAGTRLTDSLVRGLAGTGSGPSLGSAITGKDDFGKTDVFKGSEFKQDPDKITSKRKSGGSFDKVWDENKDNFQAKWNSKEEWEKQAKKEIADGYYSSSTKIESGQKYQQDYITKDGKKTITKPWYKIN